MMGKLYFFPEISNCFESWSAVIKFGLDFTVLSLYILTQLQNFQEMLDFNFILLSWNNSVSYFFLLCCSFWTAVTINFYTFFTNVDQALNVFFSTMQDIIWVVMKDLCFPLVKSSQTLLRYSTTCWLNPRTKS